jgi:transcriptional regulator with XRE-family HTH domain
VRVKALFDAPPAPGKRRGAKRRHLRLATEGLTASGGNAAVIIHDLSTTGMLLETSVPLAVDEHIEVELPEAKLVRARVVWKSRNLFGCQFSVPVPRAALSAAQLLSGPAVVIGDEPRAGTKSDEETATKFGMAIRQWRREHGLTAAQFAQRFGVSRPTVWAWETGKNLPRQSMLARLSREMGLAAQDVEVSPPLPSPAVAPQAEAGDTALARTVFEAKERVAAAAGTSVDKVMLIVEF